MEGDGYKRISKIYNRDTEKVTGSSRDEEFRVGLTEKGTFEQGLVGGWRRSHISDW